MRTVKEISQLTGVSVRTLHYYDQIDLLKPSRVAENGYRYYNDEALVSLQEILLFRELDFPLKTIKEILKDQSYDRDQALSDQIRWLEIKKDRLEAIIRHAKSLQGKGGAFMTFIAYDKSELESFQAEAKERWGKTAAYQAFEEKISDDQFVNMQSQMGDIMADFGKLRNKSASDPVAQAQVKVLQDYISDHFYPCTPEILAGLGQMYVSDNRFTRFIDQAGGEGTAAFVSCAIETYCQ
ncbi:MerR family transcriptional regulator [Streptococcus merionis]|uniref:Transcriptional activator n=1 Tax=Streptococcus merionis TaxID=400065 RepID=A0A239SWK0_9STRE|nr:MerR family transcriptional regulator [Streptococcus merionis]SNU89218.1 transcriptional activator [Streptococcus merionis]